MILMMLTARYALANLDEPDLRLLKAQPEPEIAEFLTISVLVSQFHQLVITLALSARAEQHWQPLPTAMLLSEAHASDTWAHAED